MTAFKDRKSGVLMPIFSLVTYTGIGTLGAAFDFIKFLKDSGQQYWQILPICPPAKADSPYLSYSSRAGNPNFIDINWLIGDGWITLDEAKNAGIKPAPIDEESAKKAGSPYPSAKIDYKQVKESREKIFSILFEKFFNNPPESFNTSDYDKFCDEHSDWLHDYALFMAILIDNNYKELHEWPDDLKYRKQDALDKFANKHMDEINYHKMLQFFFYSQWREIQKWARKCNVKIIGDIPLYVALTSADAWVEPHIFQINDDFTISTYSGCPANKANRKESTGQVWDSPVYDWDYLESTNYKWWIKRLKDSLDLYDIIRIDHFKGFERYYNISAKDMNPANGTWKLGPGFEFWKSAAKQLGFENVSDIPVFAEDLGIYTPGLKELVDNCKFEGIKVLQYAFTDTKHPEKYIGEGRKDNDNKYIPKNYGKPFVSYVGTHDTTTLMGFLNTAKPEILENVHNYYELNDSKKLHSEMIEDCMKSQANVCILTIQDMLELAQDATINVPGTVGINWMWQLSPEQFSKLDSKKLYNLTEKYGRI